VEENRSMSEEDVKFIIENVKTMSYTEMVETRGLTKHQVMSVILKMKEEMLTEGGR
jgi:hypothetical protein